jgi:SsrA-binding protein
MAIIPLKIYFTKRYAKVQLGIGKGKSQVDKRETLKRKTADREIQRAIADKMKHRG